MQTHTLSLSHTHIHTHTHSLSLSSLTHTLTHIYTHTHKRNLYLPLSLLSKEMYTATLVQIQDESDFISHSTNTLGKRMNPNFLPLAMGK